MQKVRELESRLNTASSESAQGEPLQAQTSPAGGSPAPFSPPASNREPLPIQNSVLESEEEANVDLLATETFDEGVESDVGYFGPSSNHAFFRALSDLFARILTLAPSPWPTRRVNTSASANSEPLAGVASAAAGETGGRRARGSLPHEEAAQLVEYYFMSIGQMTPFLSKTTVLSDLRREHLWVRRQIGVKRALLAMIYALATSSLNQSRSAEFYKDAIDYLGSGRLRGASLDLIQALMLTVTYQQNHQMSVTSWTYHALAVKTAFQLGLQSPLAYRQFGQQEKDLRLRLWYSLVTQDRILCMCLGRPCLIPAQYVRTPKPHAVENATHNLSGAQFHLIQSHVHHDQLTSLYEIMASVLHRMYYDNIDTNEPSSAEALISTRTTFQWQLEAWRRGVSPACRIMTGDGLSTDTASTDTERFRFVLSIHYYRAVLLLNAPALLAVLRETMDSTAADDWNSLLEHAVPIVRHEFSALRDLHQIMSATLAKGRSFLDQNNAWWLCNYTCLTIAMHLFGLLLFCHNHSVFLVRVGVSTNEVRTLLEEGLNNMSTVQRNSIMTQKAHQVLVRFLQLFDTINVGENLSPGSLSGLSTSQYSTSGLIFDPTQYVAQAASSFLGQHNYNDFFGDGFYCWTGNTM